MVHAGHSPHEEGYWTGYQHIYPSNPYEKGTWQNEDWWFGYQKGWFKTYWNQVKGL
jgi:hypothetical protein